jgi:tetratricopeptide (TPR) repeat protein
MVQKTAHKHLLNDVYNALAKFYIEQKDRRALKFAEKCLTAAVETKVKRNEVNALHVLGKAQALVAGNFDTGLKNIKHSIAIAREFNLQVRIADRLLALEEVFIACKKTKEASQYLQQAHTIYQKANLTAPLMKTADLIKKIGSGLDI